MKRAHYFQRYSQKENVVTNNTLLLFSRLYEHSPIRFNEFINQLFEGDPQINVGLNIFQQVNSGGSSVPDGKLSQDSFSILVETKLSNKYSKKQLENHLEAFNREDTKVLVLLTPDRDKTDELQSHMNGIHVKHLTFQEIIKKFGEVLSDYDYEIKAVLEDYNDFCDEMKLLPMAKYTLRIVSCSYTLDDNFEYSMYYAPSDRSYRNSHYLGIYKDKKVQGIGKLLSVVDIKVGETSFKKISGKKVDNESEKRILEMITVVQKKHGHCLEGENVRFFVVDKFNKTNFIKTSRGGMQCAQRYFDLQEYIENMDAIQDSTQVANLLQNKTWV